MKLDALKKPNGMNEQLQNRIMNCAAADLASHQKLLSVPHVTAGRCPLAACSRIVRDPRERRGGWSNPCM